MAALAPTVRRIVGGLGRTFIALGLLMLLFVGYQLWGTGLSEARSQDRLTDEFKATQAAPPPTEPDPGAPQPDSPAPTPTGDAVAIIKIPKIGVEKAVVEGVGVADLKKAPGHYPGTPLPGQAGNAAIAGHRTTYGAPFYRLDELQVGDPVLVTTAQGKFRYEVTESKVVTPKQTEVLDPGGESRLTLTTCHPRFSAKERLIVIARLVGEALPARKAPVGGAVGEDVAGLSGDPTARGPAIAWAVVVLTVALLTWIFGHYWRRWPSWTLGGVAFLVVLFFFFENVARLLPANV